MKQIKTNKFLHKTEIYIEKWGRRLAVTGIMDIEMNLAWKAEDGSLVQTREMINIE